MGGMCIKCDQILIRSLTGEKFSRRGTLEGGYMPDNQSRLYFQKKVWTYQETLEKYETEISQLRQKINDNDTRNTKIVAELQLRENKKTQLR